MIRTTLLLAASIIAFTASSARPQSSIKILKITGANAGLLNELEKYPDLEVLTIQCVESLKAIPDSIGKLTHLRELNMDNGNGCSMNPQLPESIGNLVGLQKLVLAGAQDPRGVGEHAGPQPGMRHKFPAGMSSLKNLTYLDLERNGLSEIPSFVQDLPNLKELRFGWNMSVKTVPLFLVKLSNLTTLNLESDGLTDVPQFLDRLPKLSRISLGNNCAITQNEAKKKELTKRFPKITFNFDDEYDCPAQ